jgi:hypothetical protein
MSCSALQAQQSYMLIIPENQGTMGAQQGLHSIAGRHM